MIKTAQITNNENGTILLVAMGMLLLLTSMGIWATNNSSVEIQIAANDKMQKIAFYQADGGAELGAELLEQNICCPTGFGPDETDGSEATIEDHIKVTTLDFWLNDPPAGMPSDTDRDAFFPSGYASGDPHTNLLIGGETHQGVGGSLQISAGYEGEGKSAARGGAYIMYDIYSQHIGQNDSQTTLRACWRHIIGREGSCNYK